MSVRSFRSVFMAGGVAAAALSCYLVSLRVASERAALEAVETEIVLAQRDIRVLQTEIGTRGRLAQLERWNVRVLQLSAPSADQFMRDSFQLASLTAPKRKPALEAPVIYASAPAMPKGSALPGDAEPQGVVADSLLHEASLTTAPAPRRVSATVDLPNAKRSVAKAESPASTGSARAAAAGKAKDSPRASTTQRPETRLAKADPLAPLPSGSTGGKAKKSGSGSNGKDSGKTQ